MRAASDECAVVVRPCRFSGGLINARRKYVNRPFSGLSQFLLVGLGPDEGRI
jgi:hypothetical protein